MYHENKDKCNCIITIINVLLKLYKKILMTIQEKKDAC